MRLGNRLSRRSKLYIAIGAAQSAEADIRTAFQRVHLDKYLSGYFCKASLGIEKGTALFYERIFRALNEEPGEVTMIGDNLEKDILPALEAGIKGFFLTKDKKI